MKKLLVAALLMTGGLGLGQGVRSLGMAGLNLPGPWAAPLNPAFAAFPAAGYGPDAGFSLPLGVINLALRPSTSPLYYFSDRARFKNNFDLLAFYDQVSHPYELEINTPSSPREIVFDVSADGVSIRDGSGRPFDLGSYKNGGAGAYQPPKPAFELAIPTGLPGLQFSVGAFFSSGGMGLEPCPNLARDLSRGSLQADSEYQLSAFGSAQAGLTVRLGYAGRMPRLPGLTADLYLGGGVQAFYGLAYADAKLTAITETDSHGAPGPVGYASEVFLVRPGQGSGYGGRLDLGMALDFGDGAFGLGVNNLVGMAQWNGSLRSTDKDGNVLRDGPASRSFGGFNPAVYLNGAYKQPLESGGDILLGADLSYGYGELGTHFGLEYRLAILRLRAGLGYQNGLRVGLGAGVSLPHLSFDAALTTHQAAFSGETVFGIAASIGFAL